MKILIIEDETTAAQRLIKLLADIDPTIQISGPIDTIVETVDHLKKHTDYDLLLLDIQLADGKSFSIFERVNITIPVIFITAYNEFALKAFELNSIDYLLKPIHLDQLKASLEKLDDVKKFYQGQVTNHDFIKLLSSLKTEREKIYKTRFLVNKADAIFTIFSSEIAWFIAEDKTVQLITLDNQRFFVNYSLDDLEQKLDPKQFFRINRQYIYALKAITKVHHFFNYKLKIDLKPAPAESEIIVSKNRTSEFKAWLNDE